MSLDDFSDPKMGSIVLASTSSDASLGAFVPAPLAKSFRWSEELWPPLLEAYGALERLHAFGSQLPNPGILLNPLKNREAQRSSNLERTFTAPELQALYQIEPNAGAAPYGDENDYKEIANYGHALALGQKLLRSLPFSRRLICKVHEVLMTGVRGQQKRPGVIRDVRVQIGHPARFVPPPPGEVEACLRDLEEHMNSERRLVHAIVDAFATHYQFETIHPFHDGNGRVGRLLLALCLQHWLGHDEQWLYMSPYFEKNRRRYIDSLYGVSVRGDWGSWLGFCLQGVVETADDTSKLCADLLALRDGYMERMRDECGSNRLGFIIESLFDKLVVTPRMVEERLSVSYNTARRDIEKLVAAGLVRDIPQASKKSYYAPDVIRAVFLIS